MAQKRLSGELELSGLFRLQTQLQCKALHQTNLSTSSILDTTSNPTFYHLPRALQRSHRT